MANDSPQAKAPDRPWTIGRLLDWTSTYLGQKGSESPRLDTEVLLAHSLSCKRIELYTRFDEVADDGVRARFKDLIRRRVEGCPVAYLVGRKEFFSLEFEVGPAVLIPRPDSETLVVEALRVLKEKPDALVLDLGTGSGNIAVAVARRAPEARVTAVDVSAEALEVARRNAARNKAEVRFLLGDLFAPVPPGETFDLILSNPPYIVRDEIASLPAGVRDYEPHRALDGGPDGFDVFDRLLNETPTYLRPGGWVMIEIGSAQEQHARQRLSALPGFTLGPTVKDGSGHPRVLKASYKSQVTSHK